MSVIVVRNRIVAADRRTILGTQYSTIDKLYTIDAVTAQLRPVRSSEKVTVALAFCGPANVGIELMHWYMNGASVDDYPRTQNTDDWGRLVEATTDGVRTWEKGGPYPIKAHGDYMAFGSGAAFALGAMAAGAQAVTAVGCAISHCLDVGGGIDYVTLVDKDVYGTQEAAGG